MNKSGIFLVAIVLLTFGLVAKSQEPQEAVLVDEFGTLNCDNMGGRQDAFFSEIIKDQGSIGYAVIFAEKGDLMKSLRIEALLLGHLDFRAFEKRRFIVVRGPERDGLKVEFWKVGKNTKTPSFEYSKWSYAIPKTSKAFVFSAETWHGGACELRSYVKLFADFLLANPKSRGHLVIRDKTSRRFQTRKKAAVRELVNEHNVPRSRLKFFFVKDDDYPYNFDDVEYWFVP